MTKHDYKKLHKIQADIEVEKVKIEVFQDETDDQSKNSLDKAINRFELKTLELAAFYRKHRVA